MKKSKSEKVNESLWVKQAMEDWFWFDSTSYYYCTYLVGIDYSYKSQESGMRSQ